MSRDSELNAGRHLVLLDYPSRWGFRENEVSMSASRMLASFFSTVAVGAHDMASSVCPVELPGRRLALGPVVLVEARGKDVLDFLGEDLNERAEFIDDLLKRCTQEQLDEIFAALAEAMKIRAERGDGMAGGSGRVRETSRERRLRRQTERAAQVWDLGVERRRRRSA